ncbi:MAG: excisionase [Acidimicrobiales bacterium]
MVIDMDEWDRLLELTNLEADLATEDTHWVTLAEAEAKAGVSRSALRAWFRSGDLASQVIDGPHGPQRLVPLEAVVERARQSPRIRHKVARGTSLEAEVAALRDRVAHLEARLAAWERDTP